MTPDARRLEREIAARVEDVRRRIAKAAHGAGRAPGEIGLVGVSKYHPVETIVAAVKAGVCLLGENYVQEAVAKQDSVHAQLAASGLARPQWHMIGHVQRRKARLVAAHFDAVESLDREEIAHALDQRAGRAARRIQVLLQVNLSGEIQKNGVQEDGAEDLAARCLELSHLELVGLMTVPAARPSPDASQPVFARLRRLRDRLQGLPGGGAIRELSMGMSGDFEVAIAEGATLLRVGTALFGPRKESA